MEIKEIIEVLTVAGLIKKDESQGNAKDYSLNGTKVIIRARDAGVHYGEIEYFMGREVKLKNSRRMWRWYCKESISLSAAAINGIKHSDSKIAPTLPFIIITDACEIIPCSDVAIASIENAPVAEQS